MVIGRSFPRNMSPSIGFTLIELMVVLAIVALLTSIVVPRYMKSVERAKENSLKTTLVVLRDAIDKFAADQRRYPSSLNELYERHYIREIPIDPITEVQDSWLMVPAARGALIKGDMADVKSGAVGVDGAGREYKNY